MFSTFECFLAPFCDNLYVCRIVFTLITFNIRPTYIIVDTRVAV